MSREYDDAAARALLAGNPIIAAWLRRDVGEGKSREQILARVARVAPQAGLDRLIGHTVDMLQAGQQDAE
jgi:hypothetical protein